jgi:hypothetical protein
VDNVNVQAFLFGVIFLSVGGYLAFDMQEDTSWSTYSTESSGENFDGDFWYTYDVAVEMGIGLHDTTYSEQGEECSDSGWCNTIDIDVRFETMDNPFALEASGGAIDCDKTKEEAEIELCEIASAGSKAHTILSAGLGFIGLTILLSIVGVFGYIPGWVLKLLGSLSSIVMLTGPIAWYVLMPDLNADFSTMEDQWGLSKGFYLTLLSSPLLFVGGRFSGEMEAYAYEEEEDWDEEDEYFMDDDEYYSYSDTSYQLSQETVQEVGSVDVNLQGVLDEEGYEWLEYPEASDEWYWRDQDTGEWVRY